MKDKFPISRLGLGTAQFGMDYGFSKALSQEEVNTILDAAYAAGIDFLDTAREYGDSEVKIGKYRHSNPNRFIVATKLAKIDEESSDNEEKMKKILRDSLDRSRNALEKSIQLLFLHQTDDYITENPKFWSALRSLKKEDPTLGSTVRFGMSVYDPAPTKRVIDQQGDLIDCIQAPYNVIDRRFELLAKMLLENGIVFISRSTFLKGALAEENIPEELKGLEPARKKLRSLSEKFDLTVPQILLTFVLNTDFIDCTLIGVHSAQQLKENVDSHLSRAKYPELKEELTRIYVDDHFLKDPRQWKTL